MSHRHAETAKGRRAKLKYLERADALQTQRDELMTSIARAPLPLAKKAAVLLTRFWADANWNTREDLVRAATWLVSVAMPQLAMPGPKSRGRAARVARSGAGRGRAAVGTRN
jgi:hypothetical protein